jgi:hypothetical protein
MEEFVRLAYIPFRLPTTDAKIQGTNGRQTMYCGPYSPTSPTLTSCSILSPPTDHIQAQFSRKQSDMGLSAIGFDSNRSLQIRSRKIIVQPGHFLHLTLGSDFSTMKMLQTISLLHHVTKSCSHSYSKQSGRCLSTTPISPNCGHCLLQTSISFPTRSAENSLRLDTRYAKMKVSSQAVRGDIHFRRNPHGCPLITAHHQRTPVSTECRFHLPTNCRDRTQTTMSSMFGSHNLITGGTFTLVNGAYLRGVFLC